jgi:hypothetical protein
MYNVGEVAAFPDDIANKLIAQGLAVSFPIVQEVVEEPEVTDKKVSKK